MGTDKASAASCNADDECTAYELMDKNATKGKPRRFRCELHDGEIDSASQASKSCKRATCFVRVAAPTPAHAGGSSLANK